MTSAREQQPKTVGDRADRYREVLAALIRTYHRDMHHFADEDLDASLKTCSFGTCQGVLRLLNDEHPEDLP